MTAEPRPPVDDPGGPSVRSDDVTAVDERPHRRREWAGGLRSVVLPLLAVVAIVGAIWYVERARDGGGTREAGVGIVPLPESKNPTGQPPAAREGRAAPDFVLRTLDGGTVRLSDLRGSVVLINFWASWCGPCRAEMPEIVRAHEAEQGRGLRVIAVDLQEAEGPVRDFAEEFGMRFPVAFDRTGEVARAYTVNGTGLPTTVFVDREGVIRTIKLGQMSGAFLREQLAGLL